MRDINEAIFQESVRLFSERGYHDVSTREIAAAAGITSATIYKYFDSKAAILDGILNAFSRRLRSYLIAREQADAYLQVDAPRRLLERCIQDFKTGDREFLFRVYRIACMEQMTNLRAREVINKQLHGETAASIQYILDRLIERGDIPAMNTKRFALIWAQSMFSTASIWLSDYAGEQTGEFISQQYHALGDFMIDMAISGKIPG